MCKKLSMRWEEIDSETVKWDAKEEVELFRKNARKKITHELIIIINRKVFMNC